MANTKENNKTAEDEYKSKLKSFHKKSDRHVLILVADISYNDRAKVFHYADKVRKAGNELVSVMKKRYDQLVRTKKYRKLRSLYHKYSQSGEEQKCEDIKDQLIKMQEEYKVTKEDCRKAMIEIGKKHKIDAVFALTKFEDVWSAIEKCLYSNGKTFHFAKRDDLPCIRAKQNNRGIVIFVNNNELKFKFNKLTFGVKLKDQYGKDEVAAIIEYLNNHLLADATAVNEMNKGNITSTYRPCYASLVCKKIRGKMRVYVHITVEGKPKPKYDKDGNIKHSLGKGLVGCDIGTQTIAYTSDTEVGLKNLAERGPSILENEKEECRLYRAMDRSRRATNPNKYNKDGTINRKDKSKWQYSKRYRKLKAKHTELCRKNAINRHLAINEDVNHIRSLGNVFVTEPKNAAKLMKRAKETTKNKKGRYNRKKRFGKSIKNRCPGYFQAQVKNKFERTGGRYIEVPNDYRASQYDHTANDYIKKDLSDRMYKLHDGTLVQRDWYSSFLLYNINLSKNSINKNKCKKNFDNCYQKEKALIEYIKANNIKVMNSGIKVS